MQDILKENGNAPSEFDMNTITDSHVNVQATYESDLSKGTSQTLINIEWIYALEQICR